jgi:hypothetical protein
VQPLGGWGNPAQPQKSLVLLGLGAPSGAGGRRGVRRGAGSVRTESGGVEYLVG